MKRDGQCPEYGADEQVICAVSLAKTRPGIFVEAIQYLLVLATPVEVREHCYLLLLGSFEFIGIYAGNLFYYYISMFLVFLEKFLRNTQYALHL